ncbi:hypothetical protein [Thermoflavifilum thermophilum]|uniref:DUF4153 domain-containing protein n=1 Tax=Thermoflavifilum thermophilum TaxID=1393122 RepID=A0A1I7NF08_9BACT|nr:hypothetical protein [Thermoflavifilum thermophilum]SFV33262.1 hypothetical protein SAMN05660895_1610 [Thermoflavifilum thermophilum]
MKEQIVQYLNDPVELERLYRQHKMLFKKAFFALYPEVSNHPVAQCWYARLQDERDEVQWGTKYEWMRVMMLGLLAGAVAKLPDWLSIQPEDFYPRYAGFIVFPFLMWLHMWKKHISFRQVAWLWGIVAIAFLYIRFLPGHIGNDTFILACLYLPVLLWALLGIVYMQNRLVDQESRFLYLQYNGDLLVMTQLILAAGGAFTGITLALFSLIQIHLQAIYLHTIGIWGLAASPIVASYLIEINPQLVRKISPIIATIFAPLTLGLMVSYLIALFYIGKNPYNDREFLLIFNIVLLGVMAIIFFSVTSFSESTSRILIWVLLALSIATVLFCGIALSAIMFRMVKWGITPNRLAVLGNDALIMINLILITYQLFMVILRKHALDAVSKSITSFLPVYVIWSVCVSFLFPVLFHFQ